MRSGTIALLAGMVLLYQSPAVPPLGWLGLLPAFAYLWWRFRHLIWRLALCASLGFSWAAIQAQFIVNDRLPPDLQGENLVVVGVIDSIPRKQPHAWRFDLKVERVEHGIHRLQHPRRIRLNWYAAGETRLRAGDRWRLVVRLKRPHGFFNPGGFDYERYLFQQRIGATGYVRHGELATRLERRWYDAPVQRYRHQLRDMLLTHLAGRPLAGIVIALAVGERSGINEAQWEVLRNTGTAHLIAISGLHIGLLAGMAFALFNLLWRVHPRLMLWQPAPRMAAVGALLCAAAYAALAGFSLPTQRALIMVSTVLTAFILQKQIRPSYALALTLCVVLLFDSTSVLSAGFWLSFGAVAMILYLFAGLLPRPRRGWQWGRLQWGISLGLAPLLLLFFHQTSIVAPLANFVAVPVVSLVVVPLTLLLAASSPLSGALPGILVSILDAILSALWYLLERVQDGEWATWVTPSASTVALFLALLGVMVMFLPRGLPHRYLGAVLCIPLLFPRTPLPQAGQFELTVLDVGQGLAAVVRTARHVLVFDTGPRYSSGFNTGDAVVLPFLAHYGITRIDKLVVSHADIDHRGGARAIIAALPIDEVHSSYSIERRIQGLRYRPCQAGERWRWDGVEFEFLHPDVKWRRTMISENNASCVLRVRAGRYSVLLTADIEREAEQRLLETQRENLPADILVVPHHGSETSSSDAFVEAVAPRFAIFAVGFRNRFGFPAPSVFARYRDRAVRSLRTGNAGAIHFVIDPAFGIGEPVIYRRQARRLWHQGQDNRPSSSGWSLLK